MDFKRLIALSQLSSQTIDAPSITLPIQTPSASLLSPRPTDIQYGVIAILDQFVVMMSALQVDLDLFNPGPFLLQCFKKFRGDQQFLLTSYPLVNSLPQLPQTNCSCRPRHFD